MNTNEAHNRARKVTRAIIYLIEETVNNRNNSLEKEDLFKAIVQSFGFKPVENLDPYVKPNKDDDQDDEC